MAGCSGVERVLRQQRLTLQQLKIRCWDDQVQIAGHTANRAVAFHDVQTGGGLDLETDSAAVTSAGMRHLIQCLIA